MQHFFAALEVNKQIYFGSQNGHVWVYNKTNAKFDLLQLPTTVSVTQIKKLGSCYEYGYGVNVDLNIALEYYKEAALRMDPFAIFRIGYFYQNGLGGLLKDNQWAFKYYFRAYLLGSCDAMYRLAAFYEKGEVCSKNLEQAVMLYYLSGSSMKDAKRCESLLSKDSINEPTKYSEAYLKYSKDPYNNSKAMYLLSQVYKYGDSVFKKDENLWKLWLEKSACNEFAPAMAELGEQYMKEERYSDAVKWLNKASVNGDQKSMSNLAFIYSLKIPGISATDELIVDLYITAGEFNTIRKHYSNLSNVSDNQFKARQIEMYKLLNGLEIKQSPNTATPINTYKEPVNNNPKSSKMVNCTHCNGSGKVCEVKRVKVLRGPEANRATVIPAQGEFILTTDEMRVYVGDGTQAGGQAISTSNFVVTGNQCLNSKNRSLAWWISTISGKREALVLTKGNYNINYNFTIPANITLVIESGAKITIAAGITLTNNAQIIAGDYAIFEINGTSFLHSHSFAQYTPIYLHFCVL